MIKPIGKLRPFVLGSVTYHRKRSLRYDAMSRFRQYTRIVRQYIEKRRDDGLGSQLFFLRQLRTTRIQRELAAAMKTIFDQRMQTELHYFRSKPSLTARMLAQLTGHRQHHCTQRALTYVERPQSPPPASVKAEPPPQPVQQTTVIREEFVMPPWLLREISEEAADAVLRKLALEQLRMGH